jgi:hypothetical protein
VAVPGCTYEFEIWTVTKRQEAKFETAEMKFLSVTGCTRKGQIGNTKFREELNIFNLIAKIIKSVSQWKCHGQRMEDGRILKTILKYNPKRRRNLGLPHTQMEGPTYSSRGRNKLSMA